ncbi:MAG: hypothetical protein JXM70_07940 [Pirellulales bacterium]|nr:hypothetical protein [Pirellulales bacterium]
MSAINDIIKWYKKRGVYQAYNSLVEQLTPGDGDTFTPYPESELAAVVFERTGLPPAEFLRLDVPGRIPWLDRACQTSGVPKKVGENVSSTEIPPAKQYLTSWREILIALSLTNNKEDREKVRSLNDKYAGPIVTPKQGAQPKVDRARLIEWWNGLESQWATGAMGSNRANNTTAMVQQKYDYGKNGTVIPDISGGVKRRRSDHKG